MSYTLAQKPALFTPGYNFMIYVTESSNSGQPNYQATCVIKIGSTTIATIKQFPLADGNTVFDIHRIIENYLGYDIAPQASPGFITNLNSFVIYQTVFGEQYGPVIGTTVSTGLAISSGIAFNGIFEWPDFQSYDQSDWLIASGSQKKFLTNAPLTRGIRLGTMDWLYFMCTAVSVVDHARLITYNSTGSVIASNTMAGGGAQFARISSGPANLGLSLVPANTAYYTIWLEDGSNNQISEAIRYNIVDTQPKYPYYRLHFLNKLGGFDAFDFGKVSHLKTDTINRQNYKKITGSESAGAWSYGIQDLTTTPFDIQTRELVSIQSDWIGDAESVWLQELVLSPLVFFESNSSTLIAVNIETTSYERRQKANEKVINIKLDISYGYNITSQRQ